MNDDETDLLIGAIEQICAGSEETRPASGTESYDQQSWRQLEQSGFTLVSIPTGCGGSGGTLLDAAAVTRAAGRIGLCAPLAETIWQAAWMLAASGVEVPRGPLTAAILDPSEISLEPDLEGWRVDGVVRRVPWAATAELVVGLLVDDSEPKVVRLNPRVIDVRGGRNVAGEPRDDLVCRDLHLTAGDVVAAGAGITAAGLRRRAALSRVVAMSGASEQVLRLAMTQAKQREQFGRPLVRFQAVQQLLARLAAETASVLVAAQAAVRAVVQGTAGDAAFAVSAAKASASASAGSIAAIGHQVLGALGFTNEHPLHRSTRRLWAWREESGNERAHHLDLAGLVAESDAWDLIARNPASH